jgi:hypothetical protein
MSDDVIDALADGDERVSTLVRRIRVELDRYLRRVGRAPDGQRESGLYWWRVRRKSATCRRDRSLMTVVPAGQ